MCGHVTDTALDPIRFELQNNPARVFSRICSSTGLFSDNKKWSFRGEVSNKTSWGVDQLICDALRQACFVLKIQCHQPYWPRPPELPRSLVQCCVVAPASREAERSLNAFSWTVTRISYSQRSQLKVNLDANTEINQTYTLHVRKYVYFNMFILCIYMYTYVSLNAHTVHIFYDAFWHTSHGSPSSAHLCHPDLLHVGHDERQLSSLLHLTQKWPDETKPTARITNSSPGIFHPRFLVALTDSVRFSLWLVN